MPQIVEPETYPITAQQLWTSGFHRRRPQVVLHQHVGDSRLFAVQPLAGKGPVLGFGIRRLAVPLPQKSCENRMEGNRRLRRPALGLSDFSTSPRAADKDLLLAVIDVLPLKTQTLGDAQSRCRNQKRKRALQLRHELQDLKCLRCGNGDRLIVTGGRLADKVQRIGLLRPGNQPVPLSVFVYQEHLTAILVQSRMLKPFLLFERVQPALDFQRLNPQRVLPAKPRNEAFGHDAVVVFSGCVRLLLLLSCRIQHLVLKIVPSQIRKCHRAPEVRIVDIQVLTFNFNPGRRCCREVRQKANGPGVLHPFAVRRPGHVVTQNPGFTCFASFYSQPSSLVPRHHFSCPGPEGLPAKIVPDLAREWSATRAWANSPADSGRMPAGICHRSNPAIASVLQKVNLSASCKSRGEAARTTCPKRSLSRSPLMLPGPKN